MYSYSFFFITNQPHSVRDDTQRESEGESILAWEVHE